MTGKTRVCLVGAGYIAGVHAEALAQMPGIQLVSIVDPDIGAARRLADRWHADATYRSVEDALADAAPPERAHVLVPPSLHAKVAEPLLQAGIPVLLEKPLAATSAECEHLLAYARASNTTLGVNQNFVFHPAMLRLRRLVEANTVGRPTFVNCIYNVSLRQMASRQFGHWMFTAPGRLLLEQAVHPLSQIAVLAGKVTQVRSIAGPRHETDSGEWIYPTLNVSLSCEVLPAQFRFAVGQSFPFWELTVVCEDGVIVADILNNRVTIQGRTKWLEPLDTFVGGHLIAAGIIADSWRNATNYGLSTLGLKRRSDAFFRSMHGSIRSFHAAVDRAEVPECDASFGADLVAACESIADIAMPPPPRRTMNPTKACVPLKSDVCVLGGSGFIGKHLIERLIRDGKRVTVLSRGVTNLPSALDHPNVRVIRGDIGNPTTVARAITGSDIVVNLAHGGGGSSWDEIRERMVGGARTVARISLDLGVRRLVHVSSIAALYLGPQAEPVKGASPPDPKPHRRADYARAKILCEQMLFDMHASEGLPVCILRPGVVVGEGGLPFHSGLGSYNNDQHCIGWNDGHSGLPFVLVEDVADAIWRACYRPGVEGRCYNLVGGVRMNARDYTLALGNALHRPLRYHPQSPFRLWFQEMAKWGVKRISRSDVPLPSFRDILSRGMRAPFDCADAERDLGWTTTADEAIFLRRAVLVHAH